MKLWDGNTPWLVTRFEDQRMLLADKRISADIRSPGYPSPGRVDDSAGSKISFILMDDPEHNRLRRMTPFAVRGTPHEGDAAGSAEDRR